MPKALKYQLTPEETDLIKRNYDGTTLAINRIMRATKGKYPRWYILKMGGKFGLSKAMPADWTPEEMNWLIDHYPEYGLKKLQKGLLHNFKVRRSLDAIHIKVTRMGLLAENGDGFTMRSLCSFLFKGQENHSTVERWIAKGWLKGKRRGTLRTKENGGDMWYFSTERVRNFIIAHPDEIDLRLVDPVAFIRLVAGDQEILQTCLCPSCGIEHEIKTLKLDPIKPRIYCERCRPLAQSLAYGTE